MSPTHSPAGPITGWLAQDHARLEALLARAVATPGALDREPFDLFRAGLLRHIAIEEKILLPAAREARGGEPLPAARRLRIDHGALAALLVPTPTPELVRELRSILDPHNAIEEGPEGVYAACEALLASRAEELAARIRDYPPVKVAKYV
ncbi:MAG TPA: hemerythrin domain-containing protein, partial [Anaeromyxobacteraceae bacterium]|nr:hemerythrin domain-containing protein [Anaeromyxobacteraceae bacterium]